jgi:hypothetical protein
MPLPRIGRSTAMRPSLADARRVGQQAAGGQRQAEAVASHRVNGAGAGVGSVAVQRGRDALLVDEDRAADGLRVAAQFVPAADAHVEHRLAGLVGLQDVAQLGCGTGREACATGSA